MRGRRTVQLSQAARFNGHFSSPHRVHERFGSPTLALDSLLLHVASLLSDLEAVLERRSAR